MARRDFRTVAKITFLLLATVFMLLNILHSTPLKEQQQNLLANDFGKLGNGKWRFFSASQVSKLSKLGRILYLEEERPEVMPNKNFMILVWKYGPATHQRHIRNFGEEDLDPFGDCSVKNCHVTYKKSAAESADLIIVHLHRTKDKNDLPEHKRRPEQLWAFSTDESNRNTFLHSKNKLKDFDGVFNWSMTFRMDSDIPVPYGRTILNLKHNDFEVLEWLSKKSQKVPLAIMTSNCHSNSYRWKYVKELSKYINIDIYGSCGPLKCPGHFGKDCPKLSQYIFYLAFENSNCDEYITEKLWWNSYTKQSIPIVMGATKANYEQLLPPDSYINVEDFATPADLARYLKYLLRVPKEISKYFSWKHNFRILNEHGYFQSKSYHYCRACEALNFNVRTPKIYTDLQSFWGAEKHCRVYELHFIDRYNLGKLLIKRENYTKLKSFLGKSALFGPFGRHFSTGAVDLCASWRPKGKQ